MTTSLSKSTRPRKSLGQHFLKDPSILDAIVEAAELDPSDTVLEIGPGRGELTGHLLSHAARVIAIELDPELAAGLLTRLKNPPNLTCVHGDARELDLGSILGSQVRYKMVGNLPYYAANPIIRRFLEEEPRPEVMVVMVQKEVAEAMAAQPGQMSILSVAVQLYSVPTLVCDVPPEAFYPPPKVSSTVVKLALSESPEFLGGNPEPFFHLVRAAFSARRKQLRNSLSQGLGWNTEETGELLAEARIDPKRRAETLSMEEWPTLYSCWVQRSGLADSGLRQD